jgi:TetR/AcrR family transcriptional regulator, fatty acid metabolism regulator protein
MKETARRRAVSRLPRAKRVADIMAAARAVFCEKGYAEASISEIALRAGVVEGTIYRYFANKRDLLVRVVEDWYEAMLSDYDEHLKGVRGTWNRLRFMIWRHLATVQQEPALCRLVFDELRPGSEYRSTAVFELNRQYTKRTLAIIEEGIAAGELRADVNLAVVRDMIYGGIEHRTWTYLRGEGDFPLEATADAITDLVYRGLATGREERSGAAADRLERIADRLERLSARRAS